jgi:M6 family metalloprotease-like protein
MLNILLILFSVIVFGYFVNYTLKTKSSIPTTSSSSSSSTLLISKGIYEIRTSDDLIKFINNMNYYSGCILMNDIDMMINGTIILLPNINIFDKIFNGNNKKISNLKSNNTSLINNLTGKFINVIFDNIKIPLCVYNYGEIENCTFQNSKINNFYLIKENIFIINNCKFIDFTLDGSSFNLASIIHINYSPIKNLIFINCKIISYMYVSFISYENRGTFISNIYIRDCILKTNKILNTSNIYMCGLFIDNSNTRIRVLISNIKIKNLSFEKERNYDRDNIYLASSGQSLTINCLSYDTTINIPIIPNTNENVLMNIYSNETGIITLYEQNKNWVFIEDNTLTFNDVYSNNIIKPNINNTLDTNIQNIKNKCKLKPINTYKDIASLGGFPRGNKFIKSIGNVVLKVIFVTYINNIPIITPEKAFSFISNMPELYSEMSYDRLNVILEPIYKWYKIDESISKYVGGCSNDVNNIYINDIIKKIDPEVNFSNTDGIVIISNPSVTSTHLSCTQTNFEIITNDNKKIYCTNILFSDIKELKHLLLFHEFGHSFGLLDLYASSPITNTIIASVFTNNYERHRFVGEYGIMSITNDTSSAPGFFAYERWLLGWLDDNQIICSTSGKYLITPIERTGGIKAIIIPIIDEQKIIVIESRRPEGFDKYLRKNGALVYVVDSSKNNKEGPIFVYPFDVINDPWRLYSTRATGESVTVEGYRISNNLSNDIGDLIEILKI